MICRLTVTLLIFLLPFIQLSVVSQNFPENYISDEQEDFHKYALGLNYYSHFRDYQAGEFYESNVNFISEFGYYLNPSMLIGIKLHYSFLKAETDHEGSLGCKLSGIPFFRYYLSDNLFCESGLGIGYGFYSFHNEVNILLRDWEDIFIYHFFVATGYDIYITKDKSLVIRPSLQYMYKKEKIPKYPDSANNNTENEIGFSIGLILFIN